MQSYPVDDLVPMNAFCRHFPIEIDMVYARAEHVENKFKGLYSKDASILWADKEVAVILLVASKLSKLLYGWRLKLNDCLRTVEAQEQMSTYGYHVSLVSKPGSGAHPRAMAVDVEAIDSYGRLVDMGTGFDHFADDPATDNPAARNYTKGWGGEESINSQIWVDRQKLEYVMRRAAALCGSVIFPLEEEWWDFRLLPEKWRAFEALREGDLHPYQRLCYVDEPAKKIIAHIEGYDCLDGRGQKELPASLVRTIDNCLAKFSAVNISASPTSPR